VIRGCYKKNLAHLFLLSVMDINCRKYEGITGAAEARKPPPSTLAGKRSMVM
jgi:hypothetical protein